jgi:hypothetical protein
MKQPNNWKVEFWENRNDGKLLLFQTPITKEPQIPTGYKDDLDVKYQLVKKTVDTKKKWAIEEVVSEIKNQFGEDVDLFN